MKNLFHQQKDLFHEHENRVQGVLNNWLFRVATIVSLLTLSSCFMANSYCLDCGWYVSVGRIVLTSPVKKMAGNRCEGEGDTTIEGRDATKD